MILFYLYTVFFLPLNKSSVHNQEQLVKTYKPISVLIALVIDSYIIHFFLK